MTEDAHRRYWAGAHQTDTHAGDSELALDRQRHRQPLVRRQLATAPTPINIIATTTNRKTVINTTNRDVRRRTVRYDDYRGDIRQ